eukprot:symbB.v1.2.020112.t1/scaffold1673.1/size111104/2
MSMVGICTLATPSLISMRGLMLTQILSGLFASAIAPVSQSLVSENETNRGFSFSILAMPSRLGLCLSLWLIHLAVCLPYDGKSDADAFTMDLDFLPS